MKRVVEIMIKIEESMEKEEFQVCIRLKAILDRISTEFEDINRLNMLYRKFCQDFRSKIRTKIESFLTKHVRRVIDKLHELIFGFKQASLSGQKQHRKLNLFSEVVLLSKVRDICERSDVLEFFFSSFKNQLRKLLSNISGGLDRDSLKEKLIEMFCFQFMMAAFQEHIFVKNNEQQRHEVGFGRQDYLDFVSKATVRQSIF